MDTSLLLKGLIIGFSIAAPVGPIGVLCIRRTLLDGKLAGLASGLGAAAADAAYGCIAGFGLTFISTFLVSQQLWLRLLGGLFLLYLGLRTFLSKPASTQAMISSRKGLLAAFASTFLLTITNPLTILSFAVVFAGLGLGDSNSNYTSAMILVLGVFVGSAAWWLLLSTGISSLRSRFTSNALRWVNRMSGILIMAFGAVALAGAFA